MFRFQEPVSTGDPQVWLVRLSSAIKDRRFNPSVTLSSKSYVKEKSRVEDYYVSREISQSTVKCRKFRKTAIYIENIWYRESVLHGLVNF